MKECCEISEAEFKEGHPNLFDALGNPDEAAYCMRCDGLRIFKNKRCVACNWKEGESMLNAEEERIMKAK